MSILTKVWGGPFKAPPMVQPVSVGWVFLKILETLWRIFLIICTAIATIAAYFWLSQGEHLASQVRVRVGEQFGSCADKRQPIPVLISNESKKTLGEVDLRFRVYEQGKSRDVVSYSNSTTELRDILHPGYELGYCFGMPKLEPGSAGPYTVAVGVEYPARQAAGSLALRPWPRTWRT